MQVAVLKKFDLKGNKMSTWYHLCNNSNVYVTLNINEECAGCGINHSVNAMRLDGYKPRQEAISTTYTAVKKIAALLLPKHSREDNVR